MDTIKHTKHIITILKENEAEYNTLHKKMKNINKQTKKILNTLDPEQNPKNNIIKVINNTILYYNIKRPILNSYEHVAILLESRYKPSYELVIRQVLRFLPDNFKIIFMVTSEVINDYCKLLLRICNTCVHPGIEIRCLDYPLTNVVDYNNIMLNITFWKSLSMYSHVLIFQTDTMMFKYGIENYLKYDYIGSPWPLTYGLANGVGNGGFSLRSIQALIQCLEKKDEIIIKPYKNSENNLITFNNIHPEDVFFSFAMNQLKFNIAPPNIASYFANETVMFNPNTLGCHQLVKFNKSFYNDCLLMSIMPYHHILYTDVTSHRYGWNYVNSELNKLFINKKGIELRSYGDVDNKISTNPWVGIFHFTPINTKKYYANTNIYNFKNNIPFLHNLKFCKGIFTLSKYLKDEWTKILTELKLDIPIDVLYHPIPDAESEFNVHRIDDNTSIVLIGSQLRRISTIFRLKVPNNYDKLWLPGRAINQTISLLNEECEESAIILSPKELNSVQILNLDNEDYDSVVNNSFVILDQINASANNVVIECISRNIPLFCNRLPAIEEYLGSDYPLYFDSIEHLEALILDKDTIKKAYHYLVHHSEIKERLKIKHFIGGILNSDITKRLLVQEIPNYVDMYNNSLQ
jgi:hypothetical protein